MFKKIATATILSLAITAQSSIYCGPTAAFVGYWVTKATVYATCILAAPATGAVSVGVAAVTAEAAAQAAAAILLVTPTP